MDVTSLYTNIPQEEGIQTVCEAYDAFSKDTPPIPTRRLAQALRLILQENSFQFCGKITYKHTEPPWALKWPIYLWEKLKQILSQSALKPLTWKRYINDIFSLWDTSREDLTQFIDQANKHHPTIKFTAEISNTETTFLDTSLYNGERFTNESVLDINAPTTSLLKHFNTHISPRVSHQELRKVLSKERP